MKKNYNINGKQTHSGNEGSVFSKCRRSAHSLLFLIIATLCSILGVAEVNAQASITFPPSPNAGMNATTQTISLSQALTGFIVYTSQPGKATPSLSITSAKNLSGATISSSQYSISSATGVSGYTDKSPYIYQATFTANVPGVYTIYASAYFGTSATGTKTITVLNNTEITFTKGNQTLTVAEVRGKDISVLAPATSNSTGQKTYSVRNSSNTYVKLTNNCLPEDLPAGTYTVTVTVASTSTHINASKTCTLTVEKGASSTSATASKQLTLSAGTVSYDLSGLLSAGNYGSGNYTYTIDTTDGASISGSTFTATKRGTYTVTITQTEDDAYLASSTTCAISVSPEVIVLSFENPVVDISASDARGADIRTLNTLNCNSNVEDINYSVTRTDGVYLNILTNNCLPDNLPVKTQYEVRAYVVGNDAHDYASATYTLNVGLLNSHIDLTTQETINCNTSETLDVKDFISDSSEGSAIYTYTWDKEAGASISGGTKIKFYKPGTYVLTIKQASNYYYTESSAELTFKVKGSGDMFFKNDVTITVKTAKEGFDFSCNIPDLSPSKDQLEFNITSAEDGAVCSIESGVFTADRIGTYVIHATTDETFFTPSAADVTICVEKEKAFMRDGHLKNGETLDLRTLVPSKYAESAVAFSYSGANATVSGNNFTSSTNGTYTLKASFTEDDDIEATEVNFNVVVDNHVHGEVKLTIHKEVFSTVSSSIDCCFAEYIIPAWDFEATVWGSISGNKKARFYINDDGSGVTLVSAFPIRKRFERSRTRGDSGHASCELLHLLKHDHATNDGILDEGYEYMWGLLNLRGSDKAFLLKELEKQNDVNFFDVASLYEVEGDLTVPENVEFNGTTYPVTVIGHYAFFNDMFTKDYGTTTVTNIDGTTTSYDMFEYYMDENYPSKPKFNARVKNVTLPSTITKIQAGAFACLRNPEGYAQDCTKEGTLGEELEETPYNTEYVTSVNFTNLTKLKEIGSFAFIASRMESVDLSNCKKLVSIYELTNPTDRLWQHNWIRRPGRTFAQSRFLRSVNMSGLENLRTEFRDENNQKIVQPISIFEFCDKLESVNMSNLPLTTMISQEMFAYCGNLTLNGINLKNTPISYYDSQCFYKCKFDGETFDTRNTGVNKDTHLTFGHGAFRLTGVKNVVLHNQKVSFDVEVFDYLTNYWEQKPKLKNVFFVNKDFKFCTFGQNKYFTNTFGYANNQINIFVPLSNLTSELATSQGYFFEDDGIVIDDYYAQYYAGSILDDEFLYLQYTCGDENGHRVFPMLSSNTSGVRTMSYFRPLDYKNIKVFDNSHPYNAKKSESESHELGDFFRTPENIADNNIEMLIPYTATAYDVEQKQVTMTALGDASGIPTKGGIYYKGKGTSTDGEDNEILYMLTEQEYSGCETYDGINYLKGGGMDPVNMAGAPHMTETSTQFISKGGTFYYSTPGTLAAYKAYLDLPEFIKTAADTDYSSSAKVTSLNFVWEDEPMQESETITSVNAISENRNGDFYNLQGMKVKTPQRSGLYISNGRKVLVK